MSFVACETGYVTHCTFSSCTKHQKKPLSFRNGSPSLGWGATNFTRVRIRVSPSPPSAFLYRRCSTVTSPAPPGPCSLLHSPTRRLGFYSRPQGNKHRDLFLSSTQPKAPLVPRRAQGLPPGQAFSENALARSLARKKKTSRRPDRFSTNASVQEHHAPYTHIFLSFIF